MKVFWLCACALFSLTAGADVPLDEMIHDFPRVLPPAPVSSRDIVVVDFNSADRLMNLSVRSLQGLVNRRSPSVWVGTDERIGNSGWWLARLKEYGLVEISEPPLIASDFLQRYKDHAKGVVIPPTDLGQDAYHVAIARAAVDDLIVGDESMAAELGLPVVEDYRGRFENFPAMLDYIYRNFIHTRRLNLTAFIYMRGDLTADIHLTDYAIQQRLFTFTWHKDNFPELWELERIFASMPDNIPMLGSVGGGPGYTDEGRLIQLISRYGKFSLGSSAGDNSSYHAGVERPPLVQNRRNPPEYDPNKVYVCIQMSDGDNTSMWRRHILRQEHWEKRGRIPLGWGMGCGTLDIIPTALRYFYGSASELDEFYQAISGLGYTWSGEFAEGGLDQGPVFSPERKENAWKDFLYTAGAYMDLMDWKVSSTFHFEDRGTTVVGDEVFGRHAAGLPGCWGLFNGYAEVASLYGKQYRITEGMPVSHTGISRNSGPSGSLVAEIVEAAGTARPAFIQVFWLPFGLDIEWGIEEMNSLPSDFEVVLPSEFTAFLRKAHDLPDPEGWPVWASPTPSPTPAETIVPPTRLPTSTPIPPELAISLINSGFELGDLFGWTRHYDDTRTHVTEAEFGIPPFTGKWMFGATGPMAGEGTKELIYQRVSVNPGDRLVFSAFLRTRTIGGPEDTNFLRLAWDPTGGTDFRYSEPYSGNNWRQRSIEFTADGETVTVGIELNQTRNLTWSHYYCDETSLVRRP